MTNVLVADRDRIVRRSLKESLTKFGYDVLDAANGKAALDIASQTKIDVILLDLDIPGLSCWEVLEKLKEEPRTQSIPLIMLTATPSVDTEAAGIRMGVAHFISKPWHPDALALTLKVVLRAAEKTAEVTDPAYTNAVAPTSREKPTSEFPKFIDTGGKLVPLERILNGGIALETLTLIEGASKAGKSVLCQYLAYGTLSSGRRVAYFTTEYNAESLAKQMCSIGLEIAGYPRENNLGVYPIERPSSDDDPEDLLKGLASNIERIPRDCGIFIVDCITNLAQISQDQAVMRFFSSCQRMSSEGCSIVVVARSSAFDQHLHARLHGMCDNHITIKTTQIRDRLVNILEVPKINNAELRSGNGFSFEVAPELGINIIPMSRVKA